MNLVFNKSETGDFSVLICSQGSHIPFDYVKLINILYLNKAIEKSVYCGDFSESEKETINSMVAELSSIFISTEDQPPQKQTNQTLSIESD